jgi:hypothetical protein
LSQVGVLAPNVEDEMSLKMSLGEIIANLESRIAFHRDQAVVHAQQEEQHREQRVFHEAELKKVTEHCEALKTVAGPAAELALPAPAPAPRPEPAPGPAPTLHVMVKQILEAHPDGEPFGKQRVTAEIARRFPAMPGKRVDPRSVSAALRRLLAKRRIHVVREGRPCHEALYAKGTGAP